MKIVLLIILFPLFMNGQETKTLEIVNPKGKWFFGAEIGRNTITSYTLGEPNKSFQGGILAEFYTGRHWSLTGRLKYFKTGLSIFDKGYTSNTTSSGMGFDFTGLFDRDPKLTIFNGTVLTIPVNIKWEFRVWKNLAANLNLGINYNFETKNESFYSNEKDYEKYDLKQFWSFNSGFGLNYFIQSQAAVFINVESYNGTQRAKNDRLFSPPLFNTNLLLNFGYKYSFKK